MDANERTLRRLLAYRVALRNGYYDDGEAQGEEHGIAFDFLRDSVEDIEAKLRALGAKRMAANDAVRRAGESLQAACFQFSYAAGWWHHHRADVSAECRDRTRFGLALTAEKIALIHSEVSEALEGLRKDKADDHLAHRKSVEVELADAVIRIADLAGGLELDLGGAIAEKMAYNAQRADHKSEVRAAPGGKAF